MLTTKDLAARWRVSAGSLANDRASGRSALPYVKIGDRVRYRLSDVVSFEESALKGAPGQRRR
jgi:hypothetical protein